MSEPAVPERPSAEPTVAEPTAAEPTSAPPTPAQPTPAQPASAEPTPAQPTPAQPASVQAPAPASAGQGWIRPVAAVVLLALACPAALFGGSMLGCVGAGFNAACAMDAIFVSPILLIVAGALAGLLLLRGWSGVVLMVAGVVAGMFVLLFLSFGIGRPVPVDPVTGFIATMWFLAPVSVGYLIGRVISRLWQRVPESG